MVGLVLAILTCTAAAVLAAPLAFALARAHGELWLQVIVAALALLLAGLAVLAARSLRDGRM